MTDKMNRFLEEATADAAFMERLRKAQSPEEAIALAAEKGYTFTPEEIKPQMPTGELDDDELDAVAGGAACGCVLGGGGKGGGKDETCACVWAGSGDSIFGGGSFPDRCFCFGGGGGSSFN